MSQIHFCFCFQQTPAEKHTSSTSHRHCLPQISPFGRFGRICFVIMEINVIFLQLLMKYTQEMLISLLHLILSHKIRLFFFKHISLPLQSQGAWPYLLLFLIWYLLLWCLSSRFTCSIRDFQLSLFQYLNIKKAMHVQMKPCYFQCSPQNPHQQPPKARSCWSTRPCDCAATQNRMKAFVLGWVQPRWRNKL